VLKKKKKKKKRELSKPGKAGWGYFADSVPRPSHTFGFGPSVPAIPLPHKTLPLLKPFLSSPLTTTMTDGVVTARDVVSFWLDGDVDVNYKTRWFAASGSGAQSAIDEQINNRFRRTLEAVESSGTEHPWWIKECAKHSLALILLLDQFSRHMYRGGDDESRAKIARNTSSAVLLTERCIANGWHLTYKPHEYVFAVMPLRHDRSLTTGEIQAAAADGDPLSLERARSQVVVERLERVLKLTDACQAVQSQEQALLDKFQKVTLSRMHHELGMLGDPADIFEFNPTRPASSTAEDDQISREPLYVAVRDFWKARGSPSVVCLSLSGGVDSMVLCKILSVMKRKTAPRNNSNGSTPSGAGASILPPPPSSSQNANPNLKSGSIVRGIERLASAHVDYGNRPESSAESKFVEEYAAEMGFESRVAHVLEKTGGKSRSQGDRNAYEEISRDARYDLYKDVLCEFGQGGEVACSGMVFGHHVGDLQVHFPLLVLEMHAVSLHSCIVDLLLRTFLA
jgi:uncharacterized protein (DUF924 family)